MIAGMNLNPLISDMIRTLGGGFREAPPLIVSTPGFINEKPAPFGTGFCRNFQIEMPDSTHLGFPFPAQRCPGLFGGRVMYRLFRL